MKLAEFEIQKAIYTRLNGNIDCSVYDDVPQDAGYPYVEIGETITIGSDVKCNTAVVSIALHGWDHGGSRKEIVGIMSDCIERITVSSDSSPSFLSLTNFTVHNQFLGNTTTLKDIDGESWHVITTMEIHVKQN